MTLEEILLLFTRLSQQLTNFFPAIHSGMILFLSVISESKWYTEYIVTFYHIRLTAERYRGKYHEQVSI